MDWDCSMILYTAVTCPAKVFLSFYQEVVIGTAINGVTTTKTSDHGKIQPPESANPPAATE